MSGTAVASSKAIRLVKYEAACRALHNARRVDEVKAIRDAAIAQKVYAKLAKDTRMRDDATEIQRRAERRLGELMRLQAVTVGKAKGGGDKKSDHRVARKPSDPPSLAEAGIDKNLADRARKAAAMDEAEFERKARTNGDAQPKKPRRRPRRTPPQDLPEEGDPYIGFLADAHLAVGLAQYRGAKIDDEIMASARAAADAWAQLVTELEARHG